MSDHALWPRTTAEGRHLDSELQKDDSTDACAQNATRFQRLVEVSPDAIYLNRADQIVFINAAGVALFGATDAEQILGRSPYEFIHADYHAAIRQRVAQMLDQQRSASPMEERIIRLDGTLVDVEAVAVPFIDDDDIVTIQVILRDITERKQAEAAERAQKKLTEALSDSLAALTGSLSVEKVMAQILDSAATVVPCDGGSIILVEESSARVAYLRGFAENAIDFFHDYRFPLGQLIGDGSPETTQSYLVSDTATSAEWISLEPTKWIRSSVCTPIKLRDSLIGLLVLDSATPNHFQPADIEKLEAFAGYFALALENANHVARLEAGVAARTQELQQSKEQVEAILHSSPDGIVLVDSALRIQQANRAWATLFGAPIERWLNQPLLSVVHENDQARLRAQLLAREKTQIDLLAHCSTGRTFEAELNIGLIKDGNMVCTVRDISERKAQERKLRFLASLQENVSDAVIATDANFQIQTWNRAAERIYGWRADEAIGEDALHLLGFKDDRIILQRELLTFGRLQREQTNYRKDGSAVDGLISLSLLKDEHRTFWGVVAVIHDITERKRVQDALEESRLFIERITEVTPNLIYIYEVSEQHLVYMNHDNLVLLGYTPEERALIGTNWVVELTHPDDLAHFSAYVDGITAGADGETFSHEFRMRHRNGEWRWCLSQDTPFRRDDGKVTQILGALVDITERKETEEALQASEARYRLVADNINDMVIRLSLAGDFLYVSPSSFNLLGYRPDELIGTPSVELLHPDDTDYVVRMVRKTLVERLLNQTITARFRHQDGYYLWIELSGRTVFDEQTGKPLEFIATLRDITERIRSAETLREQRDLLQQIIDNVPDLIFLKDVAGYLQLVNKPVAQFYGTTVDEMFGKTDIDFNRKPDEIELIRTQDRIAFSTSRPFLIPEELVGNRYFQTTKIPLRNVEGAYDRLLVVASDITDRKVATEALREQRDFLQLVIDSVPDLITVKDRDGVFYLVNQEMAQGYGTAPENIIGKRDDQIPHTRVPVVINREEDQAVIDSGEPIFFAEQRILDKVYQRTKIPLRNSEGIYDRVLMVATNITERKSAEEILAQALASEKELGELKSRFISMASHEFRTPLTAIRATADTLLAYRHKLTSEQIDKRLAKIQDQVVYLTSIIEDVLQLTRLQVGAAVVDAVEIDLNALCAVIIDELRSQRSDIDRLVYSCDESLHAVYMDKKLMRQIITNLLSNAFKYSPEGGPVHMTLAQEDEQLVLTVQDSGIGIPEEDRAYLFQPFHRAANVGNLSGTGLGLVITKESVELQGGTLTVLSELEVGSTFIATIPFSTAEQTP